MLDRIRKQKQEKVAEKLPSGPLKVCEKKHGGNAMVGGEEPGRGLQPGRKTGIWPWEFNTRPGGMPRR